MHMRIPLCECVAGTRAKIKTKCFAEWPRAAHNLELYTTQPAADDITYKTRHRYREHTHTEKNPLKFLIYLSDWDFFICKKKTVYMFTWLNVYDERENMNAILDGYSTHSHLARNHGILAVAYVQHIRICIH